MHRLLITSFIVIVVAGSNAVFAQESNDSIPVAKNVFIMSNRSSVFYKRITDFTMDNYEIGSYVNSIKEQTQGNRIQLKKHDMQGLPQNWVKVIAYKGKYYPYLYERLGGERYQINDSAMVNYWMDGPVAKPIAVVKKLSSETYEVRLKAYLHFDDKVLPHLNNREDTIRIYFISQKNDIAVFKELGNDDYEYRLMIDADKINNYPILVSYDPNNRTVPFRDIDSIDFKRLIRER